MENWSMLLSIVIGLVIRIGLPIAATALVIFFLRRLDNRWRAEAKEHNLVPLAAYSRPCWELNKCSQELKMSCPAAEHTVSPCWQFFRTEQGTLKETCLGCEVFKQAPLQTRD